MTRTRATHHLRRSFSLLCAGLLLAACAPPRPAPPPDPAEALRGLAATGYQPESRNAIVTQRETWSVGDALIDTALTLPAGGTGRAPLIIYLPGLGEPADAGLLWRESWARAGYAVLALQPVAAGPAIWSGPRARAGDFNRLAQEQFDPATLPSRLRVLARAVDELTRRAQAGAPFYSAIDTGRLALAGYDLGAQTATAAVAQGGELQGRVRALVLLGTVTPATRAGAEVAPPADLRVPVLSLTGALDHDPYGFNNLPAQRQGAWQAWPPGDKYLLMLAGGSHALLAGNGVSDPDAPVAFSRMPGTRGPGAARGDTRGGEGAGDGGTDSGNRGRNRASRRSREDGPGTTMGQDDTHTLDLRQIAAVQTLSLAFFDATLKTSPPARAWLAQQARLWLDASGTLSAR